MNPVMSKAVLHSAETMQRNHLDTCLAVYEAYRRLGFKAEEVFFDLRVKEKDDGPLCVGMTLRSQGKEFVTVCGPKVAPLTDDQITKLWDAHSTRWNSGMAVAHQMEIWCSRMSIDALLHLTLSLKRRGFVFPNEKTEKQFEGFTAN